MPKNIERQNPKIGSVYNRFYKRKKYEMKVVKKEDGIAYLVRGKEYNSPSGAAKSITNNEINGWRFWGMI